MDDPDRAVDDLVALTGQFVNTGGRDLSLLGQIHNLMNDLDGRVAAGGWVPQDWARVRAWSAVRIHWMMT